MDTWRDSLLFTAVIEWFVASRVMHGSATCRFLSDLLTEWWSWISVNTCAGSSYVSARVDAGFNTPHGLIVYSCLLWMQCRKMSCEDKFLRRHTHVMLQYGSCFEWWDVHSYSSVDHVVALLPGLFWNMSIYVHYQFFFLSFEMRAFTDVEPLSHVQVLVDSLFTVAV